MHTLLIRVVLIDDVHTSTFIEPMSSGQALCIDTQGNSVYVVLYLTLLSNSVFSDTIPNVA